MVHIVYNSDAYTKYKQCFFKANVYTISECVSKRYVLVYYLKAINGNGRSYTCISMDMITILIQLI